MAYSSLYKAVPTLISDGINISDLSYTVSQTRDNVYDNLDKVEFNPEICLDILESHLYPIFKDKEFYSKAFKALETHSHKDLNLYRQIQRLVVRLDLYSRISPLNGYAIEPKEYLKYSLLYGPSFAQWLSKARAAMTIKSLSARLLEENKTFVESIENNEYGIILNKEKYDYDSFLNERYLIDFKETGSDLHWAFKPVEAEGSFLEVFRKGCKNLLSRFKVDKIEPAGEHEFSRWINDSITQTSDGPIVNRTLLRSLAEKKELPSLMKGPFKGPLEFSRQVVHIDPANVRDTWQCYPETLFCIKRVSHLLRQVLEPIPFSAMASPLSAAKRRKKLKLASNFFMFDFKKCGLTVNRELLTIMGEELNELYPGKGFGEMSLWKDIVLHSGQQVLNPPRGTGLGNCNEGITLLQCVIGYIIYYYHQIDSIFFNDDGVFLDKGEVRVPFTKILTLMIKLGMIINLEKTMISRFNVFCEDYTTPKELDYRKLQHLIIPFADVFFKRNICIAKSLYYALQRNLIGKRTSVNILPSLVSYYGFEFHKMEIYLPFEFGGWSYYGSTSVNEVIRFLFDPSFIIGSEGSIPFAKEWMGYLIRHHKTCKDLTKRTKILYRSFVPNPFTDRELTQDHSEEGQDLLISLGLRTNKQERLMSDDLYNVRGSKNAKPKLLAGISEKLRRYRKTLWRNFRRYHSQNMTLKPVEGHLMMALEYFRGNEQIPMNYLPPDFTIRKWGVSPDYIPLKRLLIPKIKRESTEASRWGLTQLVESFQSGVILKGTKVFSLAFEVMRQKRQYILGNTAFRDPAESYALPNWLYLFVNRKKYAVILYYQITKGLFPVFWINMPEFDKSIDKALNPIKYIFPNVHKEFRALLSLSPKREWKLFVEDVISLQRYEKESDFRRLVHLLRSAYTEFEDIYKMEVKVPFDEEQDQLLYFPVDEHLANHIVGEKTVEDMLEDVLDIAELDLHSEQNSEARSESPRPDSVLGDEVPEDVISDEDFEDPDRDLIADLFNELQ
jgi:hypothetical protein